jgi:hypothetical protein
MGILYYCLGCACIVYAANVYCDLYRSELKELRGWLSCLGILVFILLLIFAT